MKDYPHRHTHTYLHADEDLQLDEEAIAELETWLLLYGSDWLRVCNRFASPDTYSGSEGVSDLHVASWRYLTLPFESGDLLNYLCTFVSASAC